MNKRNINTTKSNISDKVHSIGSVFIIFMLLILAANPALGQYLWTGDVDSDWNKAGNWDQSSVPGSGDDIKIRQTSNPYPVISGQNVTVGNIELAEYSNAGDLTVTNGKTLTVTNGLTINGSGQLFIDSDGGGVDLTGGSFSMGWTNSLIDMEQGEFSSDVDMDIKGDGFYAVREPLRSMPH